MRYRNRNFRIRLIANKPQEVIVPDITIFE